MLTEYFYVQNLNDIFRFRNYIHKSGYRSRFEYYDRNSVEEIILGYDFFEPSTIKGLGDKGILRLTTNSQDYKLKRSVLNFITNNDIKSSQIVRST